MGIRWSIYDSALNSVVCAQSLYTQYPLDLPPSTGSKTPSIVLKVLAYEYYHGPPQTHRFTLGFETPPSADAQLSGMFIAIEGQLVRNW